MIITIGSLFAGLGYVLGAQTMENSPFMGTLILLISTGIAANNAHNEQKLRDNQRTDH